MIRSARAEVRKPVGIIMQPESVRAILAGTKSQTRRVVTPQPDAALNHGMAREIDRFRSVGTEKRSSRSVFEAGNFAGPIYAFRQGSHSVKADIACPYGAPGGRLWVREAWCETHIPGLIGELGSEDEKMEWYRADIGADERLARYVEIHNRGPARWRSPRFMPRWASRLSLELTDVRVERVQEISEGDAMAEGVDGRIDPTEPPYNGNMDHLRAYARLWNELNAKRGYGWAQNPWVWVLSFKRVEG